MNDGLKREDVKNNKKKKGERPNAIAQVDMWLVIEIHPIVIVMVMEEE